MSMQKEGLLFLTIGCFEFQRTNTMTASVSAINTISKLNPTMAKALVEIDGLSGTTSAHKKLVKMKQ